MTTSAGVFKLHLVPSGVLNPDCLCVIGAGVVVDPVSLLREIDGLRMKRKDVETSLEGVIATLHNTIEFVREQDNKYRDEKVLMHRPRPVETPLAGFLDEPFAASQG